MNWYKELIGSLLTPKKKEEPNGFEWYDGDDEEEEEVPPSPKYAIGDELNLYNPFMHSILVRAETRTPEHYTVIAIRLDELDGVFRYKLKDYDNLEWVSEDWLTRPVVSSFTRKFPEDLDIDFHYLTEMHEEQAKIREIDRLLDVMNTGTDEEKAEAKHRLKELTDS